MKLNVDSHQIDLHLSATRIFGPVLKVQPDAQLYSANWRSAGLLPAFAILCRQSARSTNWHNVNDIMPGKSAGWAHILLKHVLGLIVSRGPRRREKPLAALTVTDGTDRTVTMASMRRWSGAVCEAL